MPNSTRCPIVPESPVPELEEPYATLAAIRDSLQELGEADSAGVHPLDYVCCPDGVRSIRDRIDAMIRHANEWSAEEGFQASDDGWILADNGGVLEIQRDDVSAVFASDEAALAHVEQHARQGSMLHQRALRLIGRQALSVR